RLDLSVMIVLLELVNLVYGPLIVTYDFEGRPQSILYDGQRVGVAQSYLVQTEQVRLQQIARLYPVRSEELQVRLPYSQCGVGWHLGLAVRRAERRELDLSRERRVARPYLCQIV